MESLFAVIGPLAKGKDRDEHKAGDDAQMFEEGVHGQELIMPRLRPEIVGGKHSDGRQDAKAAGPQPDKTSEDNQDGAPEFDDDGGSGPEPGWLKPEVGLLRNGTGEID